MSATGLFSRVLRAVPSPRLVAACALAAGMLLLPACNTTEGFGKDIKSTGAGIEDSAAKNK